MEYLEDKIAESHFVILLQLIQANADIDALLKRGLQFPQIVDLIARAKSEEFIEEQDEGYNLTEKGINYLTANSRNIGSGNWISAYDQFRIEKIPIEEIFLPDIISMLDIFSMHKLAESLASSGQPRNDESSF